MANEKFTQLPTVVSSNLNDIICAVQSGTSVQETLGQVLTLMQANIIQNYAGNPNGNVAGTTYGLCWDRTNNLLYICTTSGNAATAVWSVAGSVSTPVTLAQGGTSKALTASAGGIVWCDADSMEILAGVAAAGKMLQSGNLATPSWSTPTWPSASGTAGKIIISDGTNNIYSTPTYPNTGGTAGSVVISDGTNKINSTSLWPNTVGTAGKIVRSDGTVNAYTTATFADTYAVSTILYASSSNAVTGLATTNRAALSTNATGVPTWLALADGQIVIGSSAGAPAAANLTAGAGISISSGSNSITISGTGSATGWTEVTGATQAIVADNGYIANRATLVTFTLPVSAAFGTYTAIIGKGAGGWQINQNAGQNIQIGSVSSTVGAGGSIASSNRYDSIEMIVTTADLTWTVLGGPQGNITIV